MTTNNTLKISGLPIISLIEFLFNVNNNIHILNFWFSLQNGLENKGYEEWVAEMVGMRDILKNFSNISKSDVVGMRAPFLKPGRNTQYKVNKNIFKL